MDRRKFLRQSSALGALTLAGCIADDNAATGGGTPTPDDTTTATDLIVDATVERTDSGCSSGEEATATVSPDEAASAVTFSGHLVTGTPCHDVGISRTTYSHDDDRLVIDLGTERAETECADCVGWIDFEGTVDLDGDIPSRVIVSHDNSTLADTGDETADGPTVVDSSIELVDSRCSSGEEQTADVSMDPDEMTVSFSGLVMVGDPCREPTLDRVAYHPDTDRLAIMVGTESTASTCDDCLGVVEFAGTVTFEGGLPDDAYVGHDDTILSGGDDSGHSSEESPTPRARSFSVTEITSGESRQTADASFDPDAGTITITGAITGTDGCATAELGSVEYDATEDQLRVDVVTTDREGTRDRACTQQLVTIGYEATVSFDGGLPTGVSVSHDGDGVMAAAYGHSSASAPQPDR